MDWFDKAVGIAWLALTYQQNRILARGNPPQQESYRIGWARRLESLVHYWPTLIVALVGLMYFLRPLAFPMGQPTAPAIAENTQLPIETPTATPKPWQSFAENGHAGQVFAYQIQNDPIPGPHTASIVATEASHQFATMLVSWLRGFGWMVIEHGQPGAFIGQPPGYALDDGITIRARAGNVDAETLRVSFLLMGINVRRLILPDTDNTPYLIVEVGNIPADQR